MIPTSDSELQAFLSGEFPRRDSAAAAAGAPAQITGVIPPPIRPDERSTELHPYSPGPCTLLSPGGWPPILDLPISKKIPGSIRFSIKEVSSSAGYSPKMPRPLVLVSSGWILCSFLGLWACAKAGRGGFAIMRAKPSPLANQRSPSLTECSTSPTQEPIIPHVTRARRGGDSLQREGRLASRASRDEAFWRSQVNFGPPNPATDEKDQGSVVVVTLPAFQRCLEDGPDAAERRPGSGFPTGRGTGDGHLEAHHDLQATPARPGLATRLGVRGSIVPAASRTSS
ncbi:hypothetical protein H6P81_021189 [Aristolochia fimbriata]|uniref:Uncharacterized protein n=1 Tax=Aristolochia fimbriata TaxID=158543 RepID=A0AAV7DRQ0_ARIFI|nr:hypothetical protein H6P81_021189 [Aristolochia fimbriata]